MKKTAGFFSETFFCSGEERKNFTNFHFWTKKKKKTKDSNLLSIFSCNLNFSDDKCSHYTSKTGESNDKLNLFEIVKFHASRKAFSRFREKFSIKPAVIINKRNKRSYSTSLSFEQITTRFDNSKMSEGKCQGQFWKFFENIIHKNRLHFSRILMRRKFDYYSNVLLLQIQLWLSYKNWKYVGIICHI